MTDQAAPPMPQPTAEHQLLKDHAGTWKVACKFYMEPSQPPMETQRDRDDRDGRRVLDGQQVRDAT